MQYDKKYPKAVHNEEKEMCIVYFEGQGKCVKCGVLTNFVDLDFESHICSDECREAIWLDYWEASKR